MNFLFTPHLNPLPMGEERAVVRHLYLLLEGEGRAVERHSNPLT